MAAWSGNVRLVALRAVSTFCGSPVDPKFGRHYSAAAGGVIDAPAMDAAVLVNAGAAVVGAVGPTTARPLYPETGQHFVDTTLNKLVIATGAGWIDPVSGAAS